MPLPRVRPLLALIATATLALALTPQSASAGPAALCATNTIRGKVPAAFPLSACVDGTAIYLRDQLAIPVRVIASGVRGAPANTRVKPSDLAGLATRYRYNDPYMMLHGDRMRLTLGAGPASVTTEDSAARVFYLMAVTIQTFVPLGTTTQLYQAFAELVTEVDDAYAAYRDCLDRQPFLLQYVCKANLAGAIAVTVTIIAARIAAALGPSRAAKLILSLLDIGTYLAFVKAQSAQAQQIRAGVKLLQSAVPGIPRHLIEHASSAAWDSGAGVLPFDGSDGDPRGFVKIREANTLLLEDGSSPRVLEMHPQWVDYGWINGDFQLPAPIVAGERFRAVVGFLAVAYPPSAGDAAFIVQAVYPNGKIVTLVRTHDSGSDGHLIPINADLGAALGATALRLRVEAGVTAAQDWASWIDPRIELK